MPVNTLRRYKRHYKLMTRPGMNNKAQLADVSIYHLLINFFNTMWIIPKLFAG